MGLATRRGKEPIVVWQRMAGGWISMPHLIEITGNDGTVTTRCGHYVAIFDEGIAGMVYTQVTTDLFVAVGCGSCRNILVRDLRDELNEAIPDAKMQLKGLLAKTAWQRPA